MKTLGWSTGSSNSSSALTSSIFLLYTTLMYLATAIVQLFTSLFSFSKENIRYSWIATREHYDALLDTLNVIQMARSGFGHGGTSAAGGHARSLIVVIVLVLLIPAIALVFTGPTTGSTGVYTNATVANNARTGVVQFSQFIGIAMILGVVGIIVVLI